jgi:hypothetical protein
MVEERKLVAELKELITKAEADQSLTMRVLCCCHVVVVAEVVSTLLVQLHLISWRMNAHYSC